MNTTFTGLLLSCTFLLSGCALISYDTTESKVAQALIANCHATSIETAIFHYDPKGSKALPKGGTYLIQTGFPTNEWEVTRYADDWREITVLPVGTKFRVTRVYDQTWWQQGRYWLVYARLVDNSLFDREFIVPSGNFTQSGQTWVWPISPDHDLTELRLQENFVAPVNC